MFIRPSRRWVDRRGQQHAHGLFLILFMDRDVGREMYACIRTVHLTQIGHYMMGSAIINSENVMLSGDYGYDGFPCHGLIEGMRRCVYLHPVPEKLTQAFWLGEGGHNSAGSEVEAMRAWALNNFHALRRRRIRT